jgi:hypothetical protein
MRTGIVQLLAGQAGPVQFTPPILNAYRGVPCPTKTDRVVEYRPPEASAFRMSPGILQQKFFRSLRQFIKEVDAGRSPGSVLELAPRMMSLLQMTIRRYNYSEIGGARFATCAVYAPAEEDLVVSCGSNWEPPMAHYGCEQHRFCSETSAIALAEATCGADPSSLKMVFLLRENRTPEFANANNRGQPKHAEEFLPCRFCAEALEKRFLRPDGSAEGHLVVVNTRSKLESIGDGVYLPFGQRNLPPPPKPIASKDSPDAPAFMLVPWAVREHMAIEAVPGAKVPGGERQVVPFGELRHAPRGPVSASPRSDFLTLSTVGVTGGATDYTGIGRQGTVTAS